MSLSSFPKHTPASLSARVTACSTPPSLKSSRCIGGGKRHGWVACRKQHQAIHTAMVLLLVLLLVTVVMTMMPLSPRVLIKRQVADLMGGTLEPLARVRAPLARLTAADVAALEPQLAASLRLSHSAAVATAASDLAAMPPYEVCDLVKRTATYAMQYPSDISPLIPLIGGYMRDEQTRTFVELGSRHGMSTSILLDALQRPHLGSIRRLLAKRSPAAFAALDNEHSYCDKRLITGDIFITSSVLALHTASAMCSAMHVAANAKDPAASGCATRLFNHGILEGDDLKVVIPFVDYDLDARATDVAAGEHVRNNSVSSFIEDDDVRMARAAGDPAAVAEIRQAIARHRKIDVAFIDTLHNGDQVYLELRRFAPYVAHQILFHDPLSFALRDEANWINASLYDSEAMGPRPVGIHAGIKRFLDEGGDAVWEEEMLYPHNNGLYVLRRRSYALPHPAPVLNTVAAGAHAGITFTSADLEDGWNKDEDVVIAAANRNCVDMQKLIMQIKWSSGGRIASYSCFTNSTRRYQFDAQYSSLVAQDFPLAPIIPFLWGFALSHAYGRNGLFYPVRDAFASQMEIEKDPQMPAFLCMGCHATVKMLLRKKAYVSFDSMPWLRKRGGKPVGTLVTSTFWLRDLGGDALLRWHLTHTGTEANARAPSRIVVYGTAMADASASGSTADSIWHVLKANGYAQRSLLTIGAGLSYWERTTYTNHRYMKALP